MTEEKKEEQAQEEQKPAEEQEQVEEKVEEKVEEVQEEKKEKPKEKVADKVEEEVEIPKKFKKLVEEIEEMSIMDLADLVKVLEKKFGVSPMASVAVGAPAVANGASGGAEEKSEFNIELKSAGSQKIQVIKVVREVTGKGLKEAKDLVDGAPKVLKENVKKEEAEDIKKKIEEAGGTVELK